MVEINLLENNQPNLNIHFKISLSMLNVYGTNTLTPTLVKTFSFPEKSASLTHDKLIIRPVMGLTS